MFVAADGGWRSRNGKLRVEMREGDGRRMLAVVEDAEDVAAFPTAQWLDEFLWAKYRLTLSAMVPD